MTTLDQPPTQPQQGSPTTAPAMSAPTAPDQQGLPPTGLQQQLNSLNQSYAQAQAAGVQGPAGPTNVALPPTQLGSTSLNELSRSMAQGYGLPIGRGTLVDDQGNFLQTPDQLAAASGGAITSGEAAAKMNFIADALAKRQQQQAQGRAVSALQTGLGQVQQRGRGSLATLQQGLYQQLSSLYANEEYEAADFSYFIQKEQLDIARQMEEKRLKQAEKSSRIGSILGGAQIGASIGGPIGALVGGAAGFAVSEWF